MRALPAKPRTSMLYTKVKIFQSVVSISPGDSSQQGDFQQLEDQINHRGAD